MCESEKGNNNLVVSRKDFLKTSAIAMTSLIFMSPMKAYAYLTDKSQKDNIITNQYPFYCGIYGTQSTGYTLLFDRGNVRGSYNGKQLVEYWVGLESYDDPYEKKLLVSEQIEVLGEAFCPWFNANYSQYVTEVVGLTTVRPRSTAIWFGNMYKLKTLDVSFIDFSQCTSMRNFLNFSVTRPKEAVLNEIIWPDKLDISKVTDMTQSFRMISQLKHNSLAPLEECNVNSLEILYATFNGLPSLNTFDTTGWLEKGWKGPKKSIKSLFSYNVNLTSVPGIESWDVSEVNLKNQIINGTKYEYGFYSAFYECKNLKADLRKWNVPSGVSNSWFNDLAPGVIPPVWK